MLGTGKGLQQPPITKGQVSKRNRSRRLHILKCCKSVGGQCHSRRSRDTRMTRTVLRNLAGEGGKQNGDSLGADGGPQNR